MDNSRLPAPTTWVTPDKLSLCYEVAASKQVCAPGLEFSLEVRKTYEEE
jgi:hypothetical protein